MARLARLLGRVVLGLGLVLTLPVMAETDDLGTLNAQIKQLSEQGKNAEAIPLAEKALAVAEMTKGPEHPDVAAALTELSGLYRTQKRFSEAEPLLKRALLITENTVGPAHLNVASSLNNLANLYWAQKRYAEAVPLYARVLDVREKLLGAKHPDVAVSLNNLALTYKAQRRYRESEPLFRRAIEINRNALGPDHLELARSLIHLADLYDDEGELPKKEPLLKEALQIRTKKLGADDIVVANTADSLAFVYWSQNRFSDAEPLYKRTLEIKEKVLRTDNPELATALSNLANVYAAQRRYKEAEPLYRRALEGAIAAHGADHLQVAVRLKNLATTLQETGAFSEAEPLLERALAIDEKRLGASHPTVAYDLTSFGLVLLEQFKLAPAEMSLRRAVTIYEALIEPPAGLSQTLVVLAQLCGEKGATSEAESFFRRATAMDVRKLGSDAQKTMEDRLLLARFLAGSGRDDEAASIIREVVAFDETHRDKNDPRLALDLKTLSDVIVDPDQRVELRKRALTIDEQAFGADNIRVAQDLIALAISYDSTAETSVRFLRRAISIFEKQDPNHPNLAIYYRFLSGRLPVSQSIEAEALIRRAIEIDKRTASGRIPFDLGELAGIFADRKQYEDAEKFYKMAIAYPTNNKYLERNASAQRIQLADVFSEQHRWSEALDLYEQAKPSLIGVQFTRPQNRVGTKSDKWLENNSRFFRHFLSVLYRANATHESSVAESLELAQLAFQSSASNALHHLIVRYSKEVGPTPELIRKQQDLLVRRHAQDAILIKAISRGVSETEKNARLEIASIDSDLNEIGRRIPDEFNSLAGPQPISTKEIQSLLDDNEALVVILDQPESKGLPGETFVWVVTNAGDPKWLRSDLGTPALTREVAALRCGLDSSNWIDASAWAVPDDAAAAQKRDQIGRRDLCKELTGREASARELPPFDLARAHALYKTLLGDAENLLKNPDGTWKHLIVVPSGPLTQLPFQVLVTEKPAEAIPASTDAYRAAKWLGVRQPITVLPSVSSLKALRGLPVKALASNADRRPYLGIGDPLLDGPDARYADRKAASLAKAKAGCLQSAAAVNVALAGNDGALSGVTRGPVGDLAAIRAWTPLPETADELCAVSAELGGLNGDVWLGSRATESALKALSAKGGLEKYAVIHFATHGLVTNDVPGLDEPALMLTPPETATEDDDGLLKASEVAGLRLNAEWMILSACNTSAGGTTDAEALSGLARAFFYAGAKTLVVSHWEVKSKAAVALVTKAITALKAEPQIGRAEAFRRAMVSVIGNGSANNAHPSVWAPFVVVGEGGAGRQ